MRSRRPRSGHIRRCMGGWIGPTRRTKMRAMCFMDVSTKPSALSGITRHASPCWRIALECERIGTMTEKTFERRVQFALWILLALAVAAALASSLTACTYAKWDGSAVTVVSVLQKRRLTVTHDAATGKLQSVQYSSGSDPIIIETPYGAIAKSGTVTQ